MAYMSIQDASKKWDSTEWRSRHIVGKSKSRGGPIEGRGWQIPTAARKPGDKRRREARTTEVFRSPLFIGSSNFIQTVEHYYYLDKTLMIRDILDTRSKVSLLNRPRRFGKVHLSRKGLLKESAPKDKIKALKVTDLKMTLALYALFGWERHRWPQLVSDASTGLVA